MKMNLPRIKDREEKKSQRLSFISGIMYFFIGVAVGVIVYILQNPQ